MGKHKKPVARSYLQKLWQETSHAIYFRTQYLNYIGYNQLPLSIRSKKMIVEINFLLRQLRESMLEDYHMHKSKYLENVKAMNKLAEPPEITPESAKKKPTKADKKQEAMIKRANPLSQL